MVAALTSASLVLVGLCGFSVVTASWWSSDHSWSLAPPANCPHVNNQTHVCSTLNSTAGICGFVDCCSNFEDDDSAIAYDEDMEGDTDNMYYLSGVGNNCPVCVAYRNCTLHRCEEKCCDGYQLVYVGICQETTTEENWCNHGMLYGSFCMCDAGFTGSSCEIPQCDCLNGGECEVMNGRPACICPDGYTGTQCEHVPCSLQCENGGSCMKRASNKYFWYFENTEYCSCLEDYIGTTCSKRHTNSPYCPIPTNYTIERLLKRDCFYDCGVDDNGCRKGQVCCMEGCSTICRWSDTGTCYHNGQWYQKGARLIVACNDCVCTPSGHAACPEVLCPPNNMAPVITSCPEEVYVFENERVQLPDPTFYDNVGIYTKSKNDIYGTEYFKKGLYFAVYCIKYYEGNTATCKVKVTVSYKEEDLDKHSAAMIGGIGASAFIAIIVGVVVAFLCCRWRFRKAESVNTSVNASRTPTSVRSSSDSIYAVPSDVDTLPPLPPYTPKAVDSAPPPYSFKSDTNDSVYMSLAPPSYQDTVNVTESYANLEYQSLRVHMGNT